MNGSGLFEKAFKLRFGVKLCLLTIAGVLAVTLFLYFITSRSLGGSYAQAIYSIHDLKIRIFPLIFSSFYSILILAVVTAAIALISMFFSHKIAGPMYRIARNLDLIASGDLTVNTKFRGNDQLVSLADEINGMVRALNHTVRNCGDALISVERCEQRLSALLEKEETGEKEIREGIDALRHSIRELKRSTSGIRVKE